MKKTLFIAAMLLFACNSFAQLIVDSIGRVIIMPENNHWYNPWSGALQVGSSYGYGSGVTIGNVGRLHSLNINRTLSDSTSIGIKVYSLNYHHSNVGVDVRVEGGGGYNPFGIGVKGSSGYASKCIGVYGEGLQNSSSVYNAVGVYGSSVSQYFPYIAYSGSYAGYFHGNVRVTGGSIYSPLLTSTISNIETADMDGNAPIILSDNREQITDKLTRVQTVQFMRDIREIDPRATLSEEQKAIEKKHLGVLDTDTKTENIDSNDGNTRLSEVQYGLVADQLKEVFPELVYEDKDGNVSINYVEMVPLLVQSINELSSELAELKGSSSKKVKGKKETTSIEESIAEVDMVRMDQNKPNPFSESTVIKLNIPKNTKTATIFLYDLSGKQVKSIPITERGKTDITVYARNLTAGMYIYNLVVDGQVKVTRRMIVSEV